MKPQQMEFACGRCGSKGSGRATEAFLEKIGWRWIGGKRVCPFCTGIAINQINKAAEDGTIEYGEKEP